VLGPHACGAVNYLGRAPVHLGIAPRTGRTVSHRSHPIQEAEHGAHGLPARLAHAGPVPTGPARSVADVKGDRSRRAVAAEGYGSV
jgi:hypothetical protein